MTNCQLIPAFAGSRKTLYKIVRKRDNDKIMINYSMSKLGIGIWKLFRHSGLSIRIFVIVILVWSFMFCGAAVGLEVGGYYKNDVLLVVTRTGDGILADLNKFRLRVDADINPYMNLHLEPEYVALPRTQDLSVSGVSSLDQLVWDRTYLEVSFPMADLTVGRQRVAWGTAQLWNPTDVFNNFTLSFAVAEEERSGVEAVRLEIPLGVASGIDAVVLAGNKWEGSRRGIKAKTNVGLFDFSVSYVDLASEGFQLGFDSSGELFDIGVRSEIAMIAPTDANRYFKSVLGCGYTLENGWGIEAEYFFNGLGSKNRDNYDWTGYFAGEISQLAMDYFFIGFNKTLDEITQIRFSSLLNADDLSYIIYPSYNRNIFENTDLSLEALLEFGEAGTEYKPTSSQDTTGLLGSNMLFVRYKYSF